MCQRNLEGIIHTCKQTGIPLEIEKSEGPSPIITFLGMELDTMKLEVRLATDKLVRLLQHWEARRVGRKRDLLSLIGYLQHAAKAVRQGRSFTRRLISVSTAVHQLDGFIRLNRSAHSDIRWWSTFASQWNGTSMLVKFSDIRRLRILGVWAYKQERWFQLQWPASMMDCHISIKEMMPIVMAAATWGELWSNKSVQFQSDNAAVVALLNSGSSKDEPLMHLMRCLCFIMAKFHFVISGNHIAGVHNQLADALSRNNHVQFFQVYPQPAPQPSAVSPALVDLLITSKPDWLSHH